MKASLIKHEKVTDELGNTVEIKVWKLPLITKEKPHGYKYSLAYIVEGRRIIGYDNAEGKGDHAHYLAKERSYHFTDVDKLIGDFIADIERYSGGKNESKKN
jgi:hypothetical protein